MAASIDLVPRSKPSRFQPETRVDWLSTGARRNERFADWLLRYGPAEYADNNHIECFLQVLSRGQIICSCDSNPESDVPIFECIIQTVTGLKFAFLLYKNRLEGFLEPLFHA